MTDNRNSNNTFMHLLLGFAAGALTVFLSDEKKRNNLKKVFNETLEKGSVARDELRDKMQETVAQGRKKIAKELDKTSRQLSA
jgi:hypothetical protein